MTFNSSRIQALCFDVDGTLSDTDDLYVQSATRFLPRRLFPKPEHTARRLVMWLEAPGNALLGWADALGLDDELAAALNWAARLRKHPHRSFLLIPGVKEMLKALSGRYPMAVVSAREERSTRAFLDHFELTPYFNVIITGLSAAHTKPYPDPILLAAQKMNVEPQQCLMIGDTTVDVRAGKAAGAQTVGVLCGFGERRELERMGADVILDSTPQVVNILK
ncbi:MAG: phosphoglycolate phosphatase [Anaerolineales bacterium]